MAVQPDLNPQRHNTDFRIGPTTHSTAGISLSLAMTPDGSMLHAGGHSGVWSSFDGGETWQHLTRPNPPHHIYDVPGALSPPAVYDLAVLADRPRTILAATGGDTRLEPRNGVYRSTDAGGAWERVHAFTGPAGTIGSATAMCVSPSDGRTLYAAGEHSIAVSGDGGATWVDRFPQNNRTDRVWHVTAAGSANGVDTVYAAGDHVWRSRDGGVSWTEDPAPRSTRKPVDADFLGHGPKTLAVHPEQPRVLYVAVSNPNELWKATFPAGPGPATWQLLPKPADVAGITASGATCVVTHLDPVGRFYLIYSNRETVQLSIGEPTSVDDWNRLDAGLHVDPHVVAVSSDFAWSGVAGGSGKIAIANDGGVAVSDDGTDTWELGRGLSTLNAVNIAVLPRFERPPGLVLQTGHNNGFYSEDGGASWATQDYLGGDNDCSFADPFQPNRLLVFAPRAGDGQLYLYTATSGQLPDAGLGTSDRHPVPGPALVDTTPDGVDNPRRPWNCGSGFFLSGYRPLVLTLPDEEPLEDGDFVAIVRVPDNTTATSVTAKLIRTKRMSSIEDEASWTDLATEDVSGTPVYQESPDLPDSQVDVVQAAGGHEDTRFYVSDPNGQLRLWTWRRGDGRLETDCARRLRL